MSCIKYLVSPFIPSFPERVAEWTTKRTLFYIEEKCEKLFFYLRSAKGNIFQIPSEDVVGYCSLKQANWEFTSREFYNKFKPVFGDKKIYLSIFKSKKTCSNRIGDSQCKTITRKVIACIDHSKLCLWVRKGKGAYQQISIQQIEGLNTDFFTLAMHPKQIFDLILLMRFMNVCIRKIQSHKVLFFYARRQIENIWGPSFYKKNAEAEKIEELLIPKSQTPEQLILTRMPDIRRLIGQVLTTLEEQSKSILTLRNVYATKVDKLKLTDLFSTFQLVIYRKQEELENYEHEISKMQRHLTEKYSNLPDKQSESPSLSKQEELVPKRIIELSEFQPIIGYHLDMLDLHASIATAVKNQLFEITYKFDLKIMNHSTLDNFNMLRSVERKNGLKKRSFYFNSLKKMTRINLNDFVQENKSLFDNSIKDWKPGLNLICKCPKDERLPKFVVHLKQVSDKEKLNMNKAMNHVACRCNEHVAQIINFVFYHCDFKIDGYRMEDEELCFKTKGHAWEDVIRSFEPCENDLEWFSMHTTIRLHGSVLS